ncbi:DUF6879 family protein [Kitasatospora sp. NPDC005856]|uniref:DUF6879 family protein n=1 Tax=Kitasatospora sp. NPDC005856 TaxID=3154566 RepID=UPI00340AD840
MTSPTRDGLAKATRTAVHLELRDAYGASDPEFQRWRRGHRYAPDDRPEWFQGWGDTVQEAVSRGVVVRRLRIVSEPVTDYIKYEHHVTYLNIAAGEQVRWLRRADIRDTALPANDFWLFDDARAVVNHFSGDGEISYREVVSEATEPGLLRFFGAAFDSLWELAIPHQEYTPE